MLCPHSCQLGQGPLQGAQLLWGDLTVPFLMAQCSQGSGWALGAAPKHSVPGSAIPQSPSQPSRQGRYETVRSVFLGVSALLKHPGLALCCAQVSVAPSQAICTSTPRSKSGSAQLGQEGAEQGPTHPAHAALFPFASVQLVRRGWFKCYPSTQGQFLN